MRTRHILITVVLMYAVLVSAQAQASESGYESGDHELFFMPTAYTMEKGDSYFTDYEVFILNYTRAVTSNFHLSAFSFFPFTTDFLKTFTLGSKYRFLNKGRIQSAAWGTYTPFYEALSLGNVWSLGEKSRSFHIAAGTASNIDEETPDHWEFIFMLGHRIDTSDKLSLIIEYTNFSSMIENEFNGIFTFGARFRTKMITWEIAGIRPLADTGELLFIPFVKGTLYNK